MCSVRLIKDFGYYLRVERGMSPNTAASYCSDLKEFLEWSDVPAGDVTTEDVLRYMEFRSDDISKRSQARMLSAMRSFFGWMVAEGEMASDPCDGIETPKLGRYLPAVLSVDEVNAIIESVDLKSSGGVRDRAILEVLYGCGLRVSEVVNLRISQFFMDEGFVRVVGKGDKQRLVPLGEMAALAVSDYLAVRGVANGAEYDDFLFLNKFGRPLSRVSVFNMVKRQAMAAGVRKEISPHTFRHSFATHMIENGADLRVVQEMLGHESILTTEIYTHIDSSTWQADVLKFHPRR